MVADAYRQYYAETGECACDAIAQNLVWEPQMVVSQSFVREMVPKMAEATRLKIYYDLLNINCPETIDNPILGGGFQYLLSSSRSLGKWSSLTNIFQMGWNHQLV